MEFWMGFWKIECGYSGFGKTSPEKSLGFYEAVTRGSFHVANAHVKSPSQTLK